ncbi:MAG TPA: response regulator transcription factor [Solirubrobacterales bacterium]|nr:response regulator transcription factor [Solirubrobacterales bacterium]
MTKILVIDDDQVLCDLVAKVLEGWDHTVLAAGDAASGLRAVYGERPDLVILDVELPDMNGWDVLGRIRELGDLPVLMLTANDTELEKVRALRGGADDYLTKPFGQQELPARVEALLRRAPSGNGTEAAERERPYADGLLTLDYLQRLAIVKGAEVRLTPLEYRLLAAFVRHAGQILSPDQLIELAWREPLVQPDQVKLYVGRLRSKLGAPEAIETVRGFGYRYRPAAAEPDPARHS